MADIKIIGTSFDRKFRNDLNDNFEALEKASKSVQTQVNNLVIESGNSDAEVSQARGKFGVLNDRLDSSDAQLADKANREEARLKTEKLNPEDLSERSLALITGESEISIQSIPQNDSVTLEKLSPLLRSIFITEGEVWEG